jgi:hypothetical protein
MRKNYEKAHSDAVNYIVLHPRQFGEDMREVRWVIREGIYTPNYDYDYRKFPDVMFIKRGGLVDIVEAKHSTSLIRHARQQVKSGEQFIIDELGMKLDKASVVIYERKPFKQIFI